MVCSLRAGHVLQELNDLANVKFSLEKRVFLAESFSSEGLHNYLKPWGSGVALALLLEGDWQLSWL